MVPPPPLPPLMQLDWPIYSGVIDYCHPVHFKFMYAMSENKLYLYLRRELR